eukprot:246213-Rhodomonas_salina.2
MPLPGCSSGAQTHGSATRTHSPTWARSLPLLVLLCLSTVHHSQVLTSSTVPTLPSVSTNLARCAVPGRARGGTGARAAAGREPKVSVDDAGGAV